MVPEVRQEGTLDQLGGLGQRPRGGWSDGMKVKAASSEIDQTRLQELYRTRPAARAILEHFAKRERDWKETAVDRLQSILERQGTPFGRADVIAVFKNLEELDLGEYKI